MRHPLFRNWLFNRLIAILFSIGCSSSASSPTTFDNLKKDSAAAVLADPLDGAWELVSTSSEGKVIRSGKPIQFKIFHNGFFSLIMADSTGAWNTAGAGTYEVDGNTYKETFKYCSIPQYVGSTNWQEFEIKGDTLYNRLFKKMQDANGKDITAQVQTKLEEKRVRVKR